MEIANSLGEHGAGSGQTLGGNITLASRRAQSGVPPKSPSMFPKLRMPDLGNPETYVKVFRGKMNFASFPGAARPGQATYYYRGTPPGAWIWIKYQVKEHLPDPEWASFAVSSSLIGSFSPTPHTPSHVALCDGGDV